MVVVDFGGYRFGDAERRCHLKSGACARDRCAVPEARQEASAHTGCLEGHSDYARVVHRPPNVHVLMNHPLQVEA